MLAVAAILRRGLRPAITAVLALAVVLAGTGMHLASHCSEHGADHAAVTAVVVELGEPGHGDDDGGLCLNCDCTCQMLFLGDALDIRMPASVVELLVRPEGAVPLDGVVLEVEPPPVRVS